MSGMIRLMFYMCLMMFPIQLNAKCDPDGVLKSRTNRSNIEPRNARQFHLTYKRLHDSQERAIKQFGDRDRYLATEQGSGSLRRLRRLKWQFEYDGIDSYLFHDPPKSHKAVFFTHILHLHDKRYYIKEGKQGRSIVAIVERRGAKNHLFRKYDDSCQLTEIVRFQDISPESEDSVSYRVTAPSCALSLTELLSSNSSRRSSMNTILNEPSDTAALASWKEDVATSCSQFGGQIRPQQKPEPGIK